VVSSKIDLDNRTSAHNRYAQFPDGLAVVNQRALGASQACSKEAGVRAESRSVRV
jgi:hypothetical protein